MDDVMKSREQLLEELRTLRLQIAHLSDAESEHRRAEAALRESEKSHMELANSLPETVFELDLSGRVTFVNQAGLEKFGYTQEDLAQGLRILSMVAPWQRERASENLQRVLQLGESHSEEYLALRQDGAKFPVVVSISRTVVDGRPAGFRGFVVDISPHETAEEEESRLLREMGRRAAELDATFASMPDGVGIFDTDGNVVRLNAAVLRVTGLRPEDLTLAVNERMAMLNLERPDGEPFSPEDAPVHLALQGKTVLGVVMRSHPPDGRTRWISASAAPIIGLGGELLGAVVIFTDITELHQLQEQRDDVLYRVSHDLRSPLMVIRVHTEVLKQLLAEASTSALALKNVDAISVAVQRLNVMIEDLVDSAGHESGQLRLRQAALDLHSFVLDLLVRLGGVIQTERIRVVPPRTLPKALADPDRLERIMVNLLMNALKYSTPDTEVAVTFEARDGEVVTTITDSGPGIPPDEKSHLFQRFRRVGQHGSHHEGLGLGLYTTRSMVEAHGGKIWVESEVEKGSSFSFSMPISPGSEARHATGRTRHRADTTLHAPACSEQQ